MSTSSSEKTKLLQYKQLSIEVATAQDDDYDDHSSSNRSSSSPSLSSYHNGSGSTTHATSQHYQQRDGTNPQKSACKRRRLHFLMKYFQPITSTPTNSTRFLFLLRGCFVLLGLFTISRHVVQIIWYSNTTSGGGGGGVEQHHHFHSWPTVLSIRNNATADYVNALDNFLYDEMKVATFVNVDDADADGTQGGGMKYNIKIDKDMIEFHDNITVSWNFNGAGNDKDGLKGDLVDTDSVIALYCPAAGTATTTATTTKEQFNPKNFIDAATISQIQSTMLAQNLITDDLNDKIKKYWKIPSFPVIKEDTCEFRLWSRRHTMDTTNANANANDGNSHIMVYNLLATTGPIHIKNGSTIPTTIHLALTTNNHEMLVHFSTGGNENVNQIPMVVYSAIKEDLDNHNNNMTSCQFNFGSTTTYHASDMCHSPANLQEPGKFSSPHLLHSVTMVNLEADVRYYYKVGLLDRSQAKNMLDFENDIVWSDVYSFQSAMPAGVDQTRDGKPLTFLVYADQGVSGYGNGDDGDRVATYTQREVEDREEEEEGGAGIRMVHHFGDLSYAQGASHMWDIWLDMVSRFATSVPLMVGVGNHEYDHVTGGGIGKDPSGVITPGGYNPKWGNYGSDSNGECGVPTSIRFIMPANGNGVYWYSYDYGLVHTIMLSTEHDISPGSEQFLWLEMDLSAVNRTLTPWVILETHRPMYMIEDIAPNTQVGIHLRQNFEELLHRYNVDLYLAGHYHAYFRSCPGLYKSRCKNGGMTHITIGTAGAELDSVPLLRKPWSAFFSAEWGYGRITVANATALLFEFVSDQDGSTKDSTWLLK
eukprot:CAMPEP_0176492306 /NCGR_PEP_ID=MMETSP0200_2-20121128/8916_1 /TAXON_ID=947934 /ORGANISM="Chaetoceros sp., Strain GSL56" /LENGTH=816 /DNA_ID=CAMNT_0017889835 /DNA_START=230 /DNA_END=2680 /DNA_ORIENTATION=+